VEKLLRHSKFQSFRSRYFGIQSLFQSSEVNNYIKEEVDEALYNLELLGVWDSIDSQGQLQRLQKFDFQTYLPGDLMYKADMATMANSLELRSPLLDYRVVEFGLSLPDDFKVKSGKSKRILRDLLYELVPQNLVNRPKMGFGIPQDEWLRGALSRTVSDTLLSETAFINSYFEIQRVKQIVSEHNRGINKGQLIWPLLMLELWAKTWLTAK